MGEQFVLTTLHPSGVFEITLNRPKKYNALNNALMDQLYEALIVFRDTSNAHVALLTAAGKNFCSGADIKQFANAEAQTPEAIRRRANTSMEVHGLFPSIPKPIISCVQGYALAGGCGIAMAADFVIASDQAHFGYPEIKRGFVPALVLVNLSKLIGRRKALELIMTGREITAHEALSYGMINQIFPTAELEGRSMAFAEELAALNTSSMAYTKGLYYQVADMEFHKGLQCGRDINMMMRQTKEFATGAAQFKKE